jgi:beta-mannosidase
LQKLIRYALPATLPTGSHVQPPKLEDFVVASQRAQAFGLQIAIEHMRRRKGRTAGVAVWQFDDPWPAISWSVVDYYGRPKRAYEQLKRVYSPLLASFDYALKPRRAGEAVQGVLWLVNDRLWAYQDVDLRAYLNDDEIYAQSLRVAADSVEPVSSLRVPLSRGENWLRLVLRKDGSVLSENIYDLNFCDVGEINPLIALLYSVYMAFMR